MIMIDVQLAGLFIYKTTPEVRVNYRTGVVISLLIGRGCEQMCQASMHNINEVMD